MFLDPSEDMRTDGGFDDDERSMLMGYLADRRLTFEMKCGGLDAEGIARRGVPPSDLSLLGCRVTKIPLGKDSAAWGVTASLGHPSDEGT